MTSTGGGRAGQGTPAAPEVPLEALLAGVSKQVTSSINVFSNAGAALSSTKGPMRVEITPLPKCWYLKQEYNQNNVNLPPGYFEHARSNFQFIEKSQTSVSFLGSDKKEPAKLWRVKIQDKIINLGFPKGNTPVKKKCMKSKQKRFKCTINSK